MARHAIRSARDKELSFSHAEKRLSVASAMTRFLCHATPVEWSVELKAEHAIPAPHLVDAMDDLLEALAPYSAAASAGAGTVTVRMTVAARSQSDAVETSMRRLVEGFAQANQIRHLRSIVGAEVETMEELDRRLQEPPLPEIIGVAELARMLRVTKQRVSYLAHAQTGFPRPFAVLAAGPVWLKPTLLRFVETWERRPHGRPKKIGPLAPQVTGDVFSHDRVHHSVGFHPGVAGAVKGRGAGHG